MKAWTLTIGIDAMKEYTTPTAEWIPLSMDKDVLEVKHSSDGEGVGFNDEGWD